MEWRIWINTDQVFGTHNIALPVGLFEARRSFFFHAGPLRDFESQQAPWQIRTAIISRARVLHGHLPAEQLHDL
jgi:hypothetical protein